MKLFDLYTRVIETTGLDVMTLDSLKTSIANCMADLTSRGYKTFREMNLEDFYAESNRRHVLHESSNPTEEDCLKHSVIIKDNLIKLPLPKDIRKIVYLRLFFNNGAIIASRYSLSNKRVACRYINGEFRSLVENGQAIFYVKGDDLYIEWHGSCGPTIEDISFGYYQKLSMPTNFPTNDSVQDMQECEIDIRPEFEDAVVFYSAYFYYARYIKDSDKIQHYLSQYKYYVEDITHELAYEDEFNEEDAVIKCEED